MKLLDDYVQKLETGYHPVHDIDAGLLIKLASEGKFIKTISPCGKYYKVKYGNMAHYETFKEYNWLLCCRGDVISVADGKIMAKSFNKFFNLNENVDNLKQNFNFDNGFHVTEKKDGIIIIPFINEEGEVVLTSHGSFTYFALDTAYKYLTEEYKKFIKERIEYDLFPIFELICDDTFIKVHYKKEDYGLYFINAVDISGMITDINMIRWNLANKYPSIKYSPVLKFDNIDDVVSYVNGFEKPFDYEGVVVTLDDNNCSVKVKAQKYMDMNIDRFNQMNIEAIYDAAFVYNNMDDIFAVLPESIGLKINNIITDIENLMIGLQTQYSKIKDMEFVDRKELALYLQANFDKKIFGFLMEKKTTNRKDIIDKFFRNYVISILKKPIGTVSDDC